MINKKKDEQNLSYEKIIEYEIERTKPSLTNKQNEEDKFDITYNILLIKFTNPSLKIEEYEGLLSIDKLKEKFRTNKPIKEESSDKTYHLMDFKKNPELREYKIMSSEELEQILHKTKRKKRKHTPVSLSNVKIYDLEAHSVLKQTYLERLNKEIKDKSIFFKNLKETDPLAKKIARNYTTAHNTSLYNNTTLLLKVYHPTEILFEAFLKSYRFDVESDIEGIDTNHILWDIIYGNSTLEEKIALWSKIPTFFPLIDSKEKKEKEVRILTLLKNKKLNVPEWYCHGRLLGLDFSLQEKIEGEQLDEFILKNQKKKKNIINASIEQLVKIHHYLCEEGSKRLDMNDFNFYFKIFKNDFLDKFFHPFFNSNENIFKHYKVQHISGEFTNNQDNDNSYAYLDFKSKRKLIELFSPIATEISNLEKGIYIDANPANILINQDDEAYNVDFENIKKLPFQFDLSIFSAVLGLSNEEQTEVINYYLEQKSKFKKEKINDKEVEAFHRGYNFVNILRNITLIGNMHDYILKYGEEQALKNQERYFEQSKKAIETALNSEYTTQEDKKIILNFKKEFDKCKIIYQKID